MRLSMKMGSIPLMISWKHSIYGWIHVTYPLLESLRLRKLLDLLMLVFVRVQPKTIVRHSLNGCANMGMSTILTLVHWKTLGTIDLALMKSL